MFKLVGSCAKIAVGIVNRVAVGWGSVNRRRNVMFDMASDSYPADGEPVEKPVLHGQGAVFLSGFIRAGPLALAGQSHYRQTKR